MAWQGWTPEKLTEARRLYVDEGVGASEVARMIGAPSRNSVCGKASRMGWNAARSAESRREYGRIKARISRPSPPSKPPTKAGPKLKIVNRAVMHEARAREPRVTTPFPEAPGGLRITDAGFGGCRWPLNGEGADIRFCCALPVDGQSYCAEHFKRAVQPPVPGKKRSANELARSLRRYMG